jgi:hypothetical protein
MERSFLDTRMGVGFRSFDEEFGNRGWEESYFVWTRIRGSSIAKDVSLLFFIFAFQLAKINA